MILIGLWSSYRQKNVEDYFVAGRRLGTFSIACLWLASWVGGASIVGGSAKAYELGITAIWYVGALAIGCLLFGLFFAARIKSLGDRHHHLTYPDFMEVRYDSRTRIVATVTTSAAYLAYAAGQLAAAGSILHVLLGWELFPALLLASGIIIVYTTIGGFLAVTYTDWVQFILLIVGIVLIGMPIAISQAGSYGDLVAKLPPTYFHLGAWGWPTILALVVSIVLSFFTAMDSYTRCFAARSTDVARRGALIAVIFMLPIAVAATWIGLASAALLPGVESSNDILTTFVLQTFPTGLKGLVLVGILAAIMSTADICILTASANITRDVYQRYINPDVAPRKMLVAGNAASAVVGGLAMLMAWGMQDVMDILLLAFTINSAALFLPTIAVVYFKRAAPHAAFWSITLSLSTVVIWYLGASLELAEVFQIDPLWPGLAVSFIAFLVLNRRSPA